MSISYGFRVLMYVRLENWWHCNLYSFLKKGRVMDTLYRWHLMDFRKTLQGCLWSRIEIFWNYLVMGYFTVKQMCDNHLYLNNIFLWYLVWNKKIYLLKIYRDRAEKIFQMFVYWNFLFYKWFFRLCFVKYLCFVMSKHNIDYLWKK